MGPWGTLRSFGWVDGGGGLKYYLFIYLQVHYHPFMEETWPISFIYRFVCFFFHRCLTFLNYNY